MLLPYMDEFLFLCDSYEAALLLRARVVALLRCLGQLRNAKKCIWDPTQVSDDLGLTVDLQNGQVRAPPD
jgi:hypothetical protein